MLALVQNNESIRVKYPVYAKVRTTLYDMVETVSEETPGEEKLVTEVVLRMIGDYKARFAGKYLNGTISIT